MLAAQSASATTMKFVTSMFKLTLNDQSIRSKYPAEIPKPALFGRI
jgi:hypothetical protein